MWGWEEPYGPIDDLVFTSTLIISCFMSLLSKQTCLTIDRCGEQELFKIKLP